MPVDARAVRARSRGEITKNPIAADIYYSSDKKMRVERGGFHCEKLFGRVNKPDPTAFAHIELARPFAHPWLGFSLSVLPVLPAAFRRPQPSAGGFVELDELTWLYARFYDRNARAKRLAELGAPAELVDQDVATAHNDLRVLFDNFFTAEPVVVAPDRRRVASLASRLGTQDAAEREALLFALGLATLVSDEQE